MSINSQHSLADLTIASGPGISIALNNVPGVGSKFKFGKRLAVDSNSFQSIWEGTNGLYQTPTTATQASIVSSDLNDSAAGTGARTIQIQGLDENFLEIEEEITLNGLTPVLSVNNYIRLNRMLVLTAGSGETAAGIIEATVDSIPLAQITVGNNQTQICHYTIPADKNGYLNAVFIACGSGKEIEAGIFIRTFGSVYRNSASTVLYQNFIDAEFSVPPYLPPKTDIEVRAKAGASTVNVHASLTIINKQI